MRDPERIPIILKEIEKIWSENPDFRLGQLLMVAAKPNTPCPQVFYIEDDKLVLGLQAFAEKMRANGKDVR